jgi:hypothetical protein
MRIEVTQINSTAVKAMTFIVGEYDLEQVKKEPNAELAFGELEITYTNGSVYTYHNVMLGTFSEVITQKSIGKAVNEFVKSVHRFTKELTNA